MISVSIIALIFISLFRMQSSIIRLAAADKFDTVSPILAGRLLAEIEQDISNWSQFKGDFGENFPGVEWTCSIMDFPVDNLDFINAESQPHFKKIEVEIKKSSGVRSYKVHTWRFVIE